jgi:putative membrane protein
MMRNIWHIYKTDWLHILKVPTGIFLILAITILPSIYDWVNIKSVWDPYRNTQGIKIAVTSEDKGASVIGKHINIGEELVGSLMKNHKLGWVFTKREEAVRGVEKGEYYASLLIPADFSSKIISIVDGKIQKPEVIYTVNEKINAIAPKITGSGVSSLTTQINENFTKTVSETVLAKLKEAGVELNEQLPTLRKMEQGLFTLEKNLPQITLVGQKIVEVDNAMPDIMQKANKLVALRQKLPEINQAAQYVLKIQEHFPQIQSSAADIVAIQQQIPVIQRAVGYVNDVDQNFGKVTDAIQVALEQSDKALNIINLAEQNLDKMSQITQQGTAMTSDAEQFLTSTDELWSYIAPVMKMNLNLAHQTLDTTGDLLARLKSTDLSKRPTQQQLSQLMTSLQRDVSIVDHVGELLGRINDFLPSRPLQDQLANLSHLSRNLNLLAQGMGSLSKNAELLSSNSDLLANQVTQLNNLLIKTNTNMLNTLNAYDNTIAPALTEGRDHLKSLLATSSSSLESTQGAVPNIAQIIANAKDGILLNQDNLNRFQQDLPQLQTKVHEVAQNLEDKGNAFIYMLNLVGSVIQNDLTEIKTKLDEAASFVQNDLPNVNQEIIKAADFVENHLSDVQTGVKRVADLVRSDLPQLERAIVKAANKLREVEKDNHFGELAKLLRGDIEAESAFLSSPVHIKQNELYPIPNYGSAMSPFYCVLSLWVGSTLLISLLRAEAENPNGTFRGHELFLGRLATFLTIGMLQALCLTLGDFWILGTFVANKIWFVLFAILVSIVFVTITYTLLSVFGNLGKGIAIIFMVLQFSSSGGTFPVSMTSRFFQALNPFMPFTYAISLLREAVGGILWETALKDIFWLLVFIAISLIIALALKRPLSTLMKRSAENARKTRIIA